MIRNPNLLSAFDAARFLSQGELTSEQLIRSCADRIKERNPHVHALVAFDEAKALDHARSMDGASRVAHLHGIPFVAKDILETADFPTGYGSPIYTGHQPSADSASVLQLREQGAVLIGKAATSEFATRKPADTRNPLRLTHTPGGSSSGSAAAVADCMVPFALGTQTTGSIARPASYCGIVGFKPTFDLFNRVGLKATSPSQDTIGLLTRTVRDAFFITFGHADFDDQVRRRAAPRYVFCESTQWDAALSPAFRTAAQRLRLALDQAGNPAGAVRLSPQMEELIGIQEQIFIYEATGSLAYERKHYGDQISEILRKRLAAGAGIDRDDYLALRIAAEQARASVGALFQDHDILIYPATDGSAEEGIAYSGSPRFGALWTLLHLPTVVIPFSRSADGMPFGLQLIGRYGHDRDLLAAAQILKQHFEEGMRDAS